MGSGSARNKAEVVIFLVTESCQPSNLNSRSSRRALGLAVDSSNCHGMARSRPLGQVHASASMALHPWISHSGCCTSSIWSPELQPDAVFCNTAGEFASPATQPAFCMCPMPSHCRIRSALLHFLTLAVAGTPYAAIWPPWDDLGEALRPDQTAAAAR